MPTINIDLDFPNHPKTKRLLALAGPSAPHCLVTLWCYAARYHKADGDLSQYTAPEIESFAGWKGAKGKFVQALLEAKKEKDGEGLLDQGTWCLHDWKDHEGHLVAYHERSKKGNLIRWSRIREGDPEGVPQGVLEGVPQGDLEGVPEGVRQGDLQGSLKDSQSRAEQSSSEQKHPERRSEKTPEELAASPSTPTASALRGETESTTGTQQGAPTGDRQERIPDGAHGTGPHTPSDAERTAQERNSKLHTVGGIEYEKRIVTLTTYLMDHCRIGTNGSRTVGVVEQFRLVAGRFEKLLWERRETVGKLTDDELVAAAKVAFVKAERLDRLQAFTTVLLKPAESGQVMAIVSKARNMVGRQVKA